MRWALAWLTFGLLGCGAIAWPGKACRKHEDCDGLPRGYCARAELCTRECSEAEPCPENSTCSLQISRSVCLPKCAGDGDCLPGFACVEAVCVLRAPLDPPPQ